MSASQSQTMAGKSAAPSLWQQNLSLRQNLLAASQPMLQPIFSTTIAAPGNSNNVVSVAPRLTGLLKRFKVFITGTANNTGTSAGAVMTALGLGNLLQNVQFTDTSNNLRINTAGWHLDLLATVKYGRPYGGVDSASPVAQSDLGNNYPVITKAPTIAAGVSATFAAVFDIPVSYSDTDFRGALNLNVTNATASLQLTLNPNPFVATGDATLAVYSGAPGNLSNVTISVYQDYLSNIPQDSKTGLYLLPPMDMATAYQLITTTQNGMVADSDYPLPYANFRDYLSTFAIFDNGGALNPGSDVNYWALQIANFTNLFKVSPALAALRVREALGYDLPSGVYYFGSRHKPISTTMYGNQELILNASSVAANSQLYMGYEYFSPLNQISGAASQAVA